MNNEKNKDEIIEAKNELINLYLLIESKKVDNIYLNKFINIFIIIAKSKSR